MSYQHFYHDLQCRSGLGDRLIDLWATATLARLHDPAATIDVCWHDGLQFDGFLGTYATNEFSVGHCRLAVEPRSDAFRMNPEFSHDRFNDYGLIPLPDGSMQLVLRTGMIWGNSFPESLYTDLAFYGLDTGISLNTVFDMHHQVRISTAPSERIRSLIPADATARIGVHARLKDKCVPHENSTDMSADTWSRIQQAALRYLEECVARHLPMFLCSDDTDYKAWIVAYLRSRGGDVVTIDSINQDAFDPNELAMADFFTLFRCATVVQMTKYSTFSLAAALAGDRQLINFFDNSSGVGNRLELWQATLMQTRPPVIDRTIA